MKKYFLVIFCALLLFVVTGCGKKNQISCSRTVTESGITMNVEVIADVDDNDAITDASIVYDLGDETTANAFCSLMETSMDSSEGQSINCSGTKITIKGLDNLDVDEESDQLIGKTRADFVKEAEEEGFTCK